MAPTAFFWTGIELNNGQSALNSHKFLNRDRLKVAIGWHYTGLLAIDSPVPDVLTHDVQFP